MPASWLFNFKIINKRIYGLALVTAGLLLEGCSTSIKQIGAVNMISSRNVSPDLKYEMISTYSGGSKKEMKQSRAATLQDALNQTVGKISWWRVFDKR